MASALTAQKAFLNNFDNIVNWRVDIQEHIRRYQETNSLQYNSEFSTVREFWHLF